MVWGFDMVGILIAVLAFSLANAPHSAAADSTADICQPVDDKVEAAAVDRYFVSNLQEHERFGFSRPIKAKARAGAKTFLEQRINDKRVEICADRLKLAEDIKAAPARYPTSECASAAIVELVNQYMLKTANAFEDNRKALGSLRDDQIHDIKQKLFDIARGSNDGLEGTPVPSLNKEARFEWIKQEATRLGGEAQLVWGASDPDRNPLVLRNLVLAREAIRARQERENLKARLHTDGKLGPNCKPKP